ncbi:hypothetical protein EYF80_038478 [Liparis tanakae]|uniref:Uncharacterized protein n=1 Tax=Liparis tanakae TaxID=230148 RepID=A0A4Z2GF39_9TELE|nr:hypothetical protein EYF80_038478 [Liparis tanakae]
MPLRDRRVHSLPRIASRLPASRLAGHGSGVLAHSSETCRMNPVPRGTPVKRSPGLLDVHSPGPPQKNCSFGDEPEPERHSDLAPVSSVSQ